ncbi:MAG TPA: hypothetical protein VNS88_09810 [Nitrospiraceae bacterium]|nr:hypothetical protein [Nitrospiraceae bacterium]
MDNSLLEQLSRLQTSLDNIERGLERLFFMLRTSADTPEAVTLRLNALCNTVAGPGGQVQPGTMVIRGDQARNYLKGLGEATIVPFNGLAPWTHMALADRAWWLLEMN